jgi:hypothetical protein
MAHNPLLAPVVALVAWTILMLFWLAFARGPLLRGRKLPPGTRGVDLEQAHPGKVHWPAHNYEHLLEQPTLFYAIVLSLVLLKSQHPVNLWLAWGYVAFRVAHSLVQATINIVQLRFGLFLGGTLCLIGLTLHAALALIHG